MLDFSKLPLGTWVRDGFTPPDERRIDRFEEVGTIGRRGRPTSLVRFFAMKSGARHKGRWYDQWGRVCNTATAGAPLPHDLVPWFRLPPEKRGQKPFDLRWLPPGTKMKTVGGLDAVLDRVVDDRVVDDQIVLNVPALGMRSHGADLRYYSDLRGGLLWRVRRRDVDVLLDSIVLPPEPWPVPAAVAGAAEAKTMAAKTTVAEPYRNPFTMHEWE